MFGFGSAKKKKVYVFLGQEDHNGTYCSLLAQTYAEAARKAGHEVRLTNIGDMKFDPMLHMGYKTIQELEPDLKKFQEDMRWADHIVFIYPTWWSAMPAIMKGLIDRAWLPGFAFHMYKNGMGWERLLRGKTGRVITTMDSWPIAERILFGDSTNEIGKAILRFSGIHTKITKIGPLKNVSDATRARYEHKIAKLGRKAI